MFHLWFWLWFLIMVLITIFCDIKKSSCDMSRDSHETLQDDYEILRDGFKTLKETVGRHWEMVRRHQKMVRRHWEMVRLHKGMVRLLRWLWDTETVTRHLINFFCSLWREKWSFSQACACVYIPPACLSVCRSVITIILNAFIYKKIVRTQDCHNNSRSSSTRKGIKSTSVIKGIK